MLKHLCLRAAVPKMMFSQKATLVITCKLENSESFILSNRKIKTVNVFFVVVVFFILRHSAISGSYIRFMKSTVLIIERIWQKYSRRYLSECIRSHRPVT